MLTHDCQCCDCNFNYDVDEYSGILTVETDNNIVTYKEFEAVRCPKCNSKNKVELDVY